MRFFIIADFPAGVSVDTIRDQLLRASDAHVVSIEEDDSTWV